MKDGLLALYEQNQPERAVTLFQAVLAKIPTHYGAALQLAKALDAAGRHSEADRQWDTVIQAARAIADGETEAMAQARMTAQAHVAKMQHGLQLLYVEKQPDRAAAVFREILAEFPGHYGASFQLARALQGSGHPDEAVALWIKVIEMARGYGDSPNEALAREGLAASREAAALRQAHE